MATEQLQALGIENEKKMDLSLLVNDATWKDILIELVRTNKLDPWNIDIVDIVDKYISAIKALKVMDLRVPANIILAAALLLRLKSEMLSLFERNDEIIEDGEEQDFVRPNITVDELSLRLRPPIKRKIALIELIHALDEAMKIKDRKGAQKIINGVQFNIKFDDVDMEKETERLYDEIKKRVDKKNMTTFSYLSKDISIVNNDLVIGLFIPLLFLTHKERIFLLQEEFFGEIIIQLAG
ncbi:MAG: segregation/condensation protein A [Candidatus Micrarchaeia archaeon]